MPEKSTVARARKDKRQGKSPSTQAGEFVHEEIEHVREGKHGARSARQAIAIGLSKARRAGIDVPAPRRGSKSNGETDNGRASEHASSSATRRRPSRKRSEAVTKALKKEPRRAASHLALERQAKKAARARGPADRSRAAKKAARTRKRK